LQAVIGVCGLMALGDPVGSFVDGARDSYQSWVRPEGDLRKAYRWISAHTPRDAVVIAPPSPEESHYLTERAQVVNWHYCPPGRVKEWRERLQALLGRDLETMRPKLLNSEREELFNRLNKDQIREIMQRYGGDYLVSRQQYHFPILFSTATYRVYALTGVGQARHSRQSGSFPFRLLLLLDRC
jgi:hypothetical protein